MDITIFNRYNPEFDSTMSTQGNYDLRLPSNKMQLFVAKKYPILNESLSCAAADHADEAEDGTLSRDMRGRRERERESERERERGRDGGEKEKEKMRKRK